MLAALDRSIPVGVTWTRPAGGMLIWVTLPDGLDSKSLLRESLATEGVILVPGAPFFADGGGQRHLRLNYTRSDDATIERGGYRAVGGVDCAARCGTSRTSAGRGDGVSEQFLSLVVFAVAMTFSPGSNNVLMATSGEQVGLRGIPLRLGVVAGIVTELAVAGIGLGAAIEAEPSLQTAMKAVGTAYLIWLGLKIARAGAVDLSPGERPSRSGFMVGFINTLLNPKGWTMALSATAGYAALASSAPHLALLLSLVFAGVAVPNWLLWCGGGQAVARSLRTDRHWQVANGLLGLLVVGSIVPMWLR